MGIFSREKYVLIDIEEKEIVWEGKELLSRESVLQDIKDDKLEESLYRMEIWKSGRKVKNAWVMRKQRKAKTPEEIAADSREAAEAFISQDAQDIKERVESHKAFAQKVKETYGIESASAINNIKIPTGKDGTLGILEAVQIATAQSAYVGIRENPSEVAASVKSIMNMIPTVLAGISQLIATKITESNKKKEKPPVTKEEPPKKAETTETPQPEAKLKEPATKKETISEGITKTTFVPDNSIEPITHYKTPVTTPLNTTDSVDTPPELTPTVTYDQYKIDMLGNPEEEVEEELETE